MMDKIRPVLKQIFWIMTGLVVLMAVYGWRSASVALDETIAEDRKLLDTNLKAAGQGKGAPNEKWTLAAKQLNEVYRSEFSEAEHELHAGQLAVREFPEGDGGEELARIPFMNKISFRPLRGRFRDLYQDHLLKQVKILDPFIVPENRGLIVVNPKEIPQADQSEWPRREPTSGEIWNALEDLWLLRSLFESIASVNDGSERLGTSPVRELISLRFRGGTPSAGGGAAAAAAPAPLFGGGGGGGGFSGFGRGRESEPEAAPAVGGGGNPALTFSGDFDSDLLTEEFGAEGAADAPPPQPTGGGGGFMRGPPTGGLFGGPAAAPVPQAAAADEGEAEQQIDQSQFKSRYVHHAAEYRTRAFLLHVRVEQDDIPALLAELTNSRFPVEIVRVSSKFTTGEASGPTAARRQTSRQQRSTGSGFAALGARMGGGRSRPAPSTSASAAPRRRGGFGRIGQGGTGFGSGIGGRRTGAGGAGRRGSQWKAEGGDLLSRLASDDVEPGLAAKGEEQKARALADVSLAEVRIAGLLTLYRTKAENLAAAETELDEEAEAANDSVNESEAPSEESDGNGSEEG